MPDSAAKPRDRPARLRPAGGLQTTSGQAARALRRFPAPIAARRVPPYGRASDHPFDSSTRPACGGLRRDRDDPATVRPATALLPQAALPATTCPHVAMYCRRADWMVATSRKPAVAGVRAQAAPGIAVAKGQTEINSCVSGAKPSVPGHQPRIAQLLAQTIQQWSVAPRAGGIALQWLAHLGGAGRADHGPPGPVEIEAGRIERQSAKIEQPAD